jgi:transposase
MWRRQLTKAAKEIDPPSKRRVLLVCGATKVHSVDQLCSVILHKLGADPRNGDLYVFCDESHTSLRYLEWDGTGFCLGYRKAQWGTYPWPSEEWCATLEITEKEFAFLRGKSVVWPSKKP